MRITDSGWSPALTRALDHGIDRTLPAIAQEWVDAIRTRTEAGIAADGSRFQPKRDGSASNLIDSGDMLRGFGVQRIDSGGFRLAPDRKQQHKALAHQRGTGNAPQRAWVGVEADLVDAARERIATAATGKRR